MHAPFKSGTFRITSPFGWRTLNGRRDYHKGIDIVGANGDTQVTAVRDGVVLQSRIITNRNNLTWQWGNYVSVKADDGHTHYYCHLDSRAVKQGQIVKAGDLIGIMGNTGYSFGAHTHFEVRTASGRSIDAAKYLGIKNADGTYTMTTEKQEPKPALKQNTDIAVGDKVRVLNVTTQGRRKYGRTYIGGKFVVYHDEYDVLQVNGDRVVIGRGKLITAAVKAADLEKRS